MTPEGEGQEPSVAWAPCFVIVYFLWQLLSGNIRERRSGAVSDLGTLPNGWFIIVYVDMTTVHR